MNPSVVRQSIYEIASGIDSLARSGRDEFVRALPGATLFFGYLARYSSEDAYFRTTRDCIERSADAVGQLRLPVGLYGGVAGLVWPLAHLERQGIMVSQIDLDDVDELLIEAVPESITPAYDLISGVVGLGVYFLERTPDPSACEGLRRVLDRLYATAIRDQHGARWLTSASLVPAIQRAKAPDGKYDLGMAHGIAGVIALLALMVIENHDAERSLILLEESVRWLVGYESTEVAGCAYASTLDARDLSAISVRRPAWCYGDLGIATAYRLAAMALEDPSLRSRATRLARGAASIAAMSTRGTVDTSLCHGAAGIAHLLGLLGRTLQAPDLQDKSAAWQETALAMRNHEEGIAGYYFMDYSSGAARRMPDATFLQGATGVGLSLLSMLRPTNGSSWERLLLIS